MFCNSLVGPLGVLAPSVDARVVQALVDVDAAVGAAEAGVAPAVERVRLGDVRTPTWSKARTQSVYSFSLFRLIFVRNILLVQAS